MTRLLGLTLMTTLAGFACSAGGSGSNTTPGIGGASSGGSGGALFGGAGGKAGFGGGINPAGGAAGTGTNGSGGECAGVSQKADNQVRPVDIIMAIDNSGSMTFEAQEVQNNMNTFAGAILNQGIDVHVVIISVAGPPGFGSNGVCVPPALGSGTCPNDSKAPAYQRVDREVGSHDALQIIIAEYPNYKRTLRQTALKYFAVVTDDDSNMTTQQFIQAVGTLDVGWFDAWRFFGVFCTGACPVFLACANTGTVYGELTRQSGTVPGDMCQGQSNFGTVFTQLAQTVATNKKLDCQWTIPAAPRRTDIRPHEGQRPLHADWWRPEGVCLRRRASSVRPDRRLVLR